MLINYSSIKQTLDQKYTLADCVEYTSNVKKSVIHAIVSKLSSQP